VYRDCVNDFEILNHRCKYYLKKYINQFLNFYCLGELFLLVTIVIKYIVEYKLNKDIF